MDSQQAMIPADPRQAAPHQRAARRIGFVSTRFAGTDGVSLEAQKWAQVLTRMGHQCFYFAGLADTPPPRTYVVSEAFFGHPLVARLQAAGAPPGSHPLYGRIDPLPQGPPRRFRARL